MASKEKLYEKSEKAGRRGNLERALRLEKKADRKAVAAKGRRR